MLVLVGLGTLAIVAAGALLLVLGVVGMLWRGMLGRCRCEAHGRDDTATTCRS